MEIKSKDKSSFDAVYDEIADEVYRVALYYSKDHHAAEDITQTVFMKWYIDYENVSKERILAWAKVTAKNLALNYKRDKKYEVDIEMEDIEDIIDAREHEESIEEFLEYRNKNQLRIELIKEIYEALYRKNPRWYDAVMMSVVLGRPQIEVAKTMGITVGSLRIMLFRAKNWIRKKYQEQLERLKYE